MKNLLLGLFFVSVYQTSNEYSLKRGSCPAGYVSCERGINWRSNNGSSCLKEVNLCDKNMDCTDGSDEKYCYENFNFEYIGFTLRFVQGLCDTDYVLCLNGSLENEDHVHGDKRCFKSTWICDKDKDCTDSESDFKFCPYDTDTQLFHFEFSQKDCPNDYYKCKDGNPKNRENSKDNCISKEAICDGNKDCDDNSDETYCPYFFEFPLAEHRDFSQEGCPPNYYKCIRGKPKNTNNLSQTCIMKSWICDGNIDCYDRSDERYCPYTFKPVNSTSTTTELIQTETVKRAFNSSIYYSVDINDKTHTKEENFTSNYQEVHYPLIIHFYIVVIILCLVLITILKVYTLLYNYRKGISNSTYHLNQI